MKTLFFYIIFPGIGTLLVLFVWDLWLHEFCAKIRNRDIKIFTKQIAWCKDFRQLISQNLKPNTRQLDIYYRDFTEQINLKIVFENKTLKFEQIETMKISPRKDDAIEYYLVINYDKYLMINHSQRKKIGETVDQISGLPNYRSYPIYMHSRMIDQPSIAILKENIKRYERNNRSSFRSRR